MTIERIASSNVVSVETQENTSGPAGIPGALAAIDTGAGAIFESSTRSLVGAAVVASIDDRELVGSSSSVVTASVVPSEVTPKAAKTITLTSPRIQAAREIIENLASKDDKALEKNKAIIRRYLNEIGTTTLYDGFGNVEARGTGKLKKISESLEKNFFDNYQSALMISSELNALVDILESYLKESEIKGSHADREVEALFGDIGGALMESQRVQAEIFSQLIPDTRHYEDGVRQGSGEETLPSAVSVTGNSCFPFFRESYEAKLTKMKKAFEKSAKIAGMPQGQIDLIKDAYLEQALRFRNPEHEKIAVLALTFSAAEPKMIFVSGRKGLVIEDSGAKVVSFKW